MAGTPEMQEHFPAGAWMAGMPKNEGALSGWCLDGPTHRKRSSIFSTHGWRTCRRSVFRRGHYQTVASNVHKLKLPQAALHRPRCGIVRTAQCAALIAPYLVVGTCRVQQGRRPHCTDHVAASFERRNALRLLRPTWLSALVAC